MSASRLMFLKDHRGISMEIEFQGGKTGQKQPAERLLNSEVQKEGGAWGSCWLLGYFGMAEPVSKWDRGGRE